MQNPEIEMGFKNIYISGTFTGQAEETSGREKI